MRLLYRPNRILVSWPSFIAYLSTQCLEWNNVP